MELRGNAFEECGQIGRLSKSLGNIAARLLQLADLHCPLHSKYWSIRQIELSSHQARDRGSEMYLVIVGQGRNDTPDVAVPKELNRCSLGHIRLTPDWLW
jgi:hypothetical protein